MRIALGILLFLVPFVEVDTTHADTISYWHVYRNDSLIFDKSRSLAETITLSRLSPNERIGIGYYFCIQAVGWRSLELWTPDRKLWKRYESPDHDSSKPHYLPAADLIEYDRAHKGEKLFVSINFKDPNMRIDSLVVFSFK